MLSFLRSFYASLGRRQKPRRPPSRLRGLERLEARDVPAISVLSPFGSPTLTINADTTSFNNVVVTRENNAIIGPILAVRNNGGQQVFFIRSGPITGIVFNGSANGDVFRNGTNVPSTISGNGGNDTLTGGASFDTISGGAGNDAIDGGDTSVNLLVESGGSFTLADPAPGSPSATLSGAATGNDLLLRIQNVRLSGSVGNDLFFAKGYSGRVDLNGGVGNDLFILGAGPAVVDGGGNGPTGDGDVVFADGIGSARFDGSNLLTSRGTYTLRNVEAITLSGTAGNDTFDLAGLTQTLRVNGLGGDDVIRGGSGTNRIDGGPGTNVILTSAGTDVITPGNDLLDGLLNRALAPAELSATAGPLRVALAGDRLNVFGPTGAGFTLRGAWRREVVNGAERFVVSGDVTLNTGLGDLQFVVPDLEPVAFLTAADGVAGFGVVAAMNWTSPPELHTLTTSGPLDLFRSRYGLELTATGASWQLALGRDVPGGGTMPLNPAVPYLYFTANPGFLAAFAGRSAPTDGASLTVVFDPSDPSLFVRSSVPDAFEVGVSAKGLIPFRPAHPSVNSFFGNLATPATLTFGDGDFGATASGLAVFDFDANNDGSSDTPSPEAIRRLISSELSVDEQFSGTLDVVVGLNGAAEFEYCGSGFDFPIISNHVSLSYTAGGLLASGGSVSTVGDTPLGLFSPDGATLDVRFLPRINAFSASLRGSPAGTLGRVLPVPAVLILTNAGVILSGHTVGVLGFGSFPVSGPVTRDVVTGRALYDLSGTRSSDYVLISAGSENLPTGPIILARNTVEAAKARVTNLFSAARFTIDFSEGVSFDGAFVDSSGTVAGTLSVTVAPGGVRVTGSGTLVGTADPLTGDSFPFGHDWVLENNNQLKLNVPGFLAGTIFRFNAAPAFRDRSITPLAAVGGLVTLSGRITEADPADKFILEVNWGDGTVETFTFPPGSDGRLVEVTHRYRKASPPGKPYRVTAAWRDPQGAGNSAEFAVTVEVAQKSTPNGGLIRASVKAILRAASLGEAREVRADFDGDGVADVLALQRSGKAPRLHVLSGRTGEALTSFARKDAPQTITLIDRDGGLASFVVEWRNKQGVDAIAFRDRLGGETFLQVVFDGRG